MNQNVQAKFDTQESQEIEQVSLYPWSSMEINELQLLQSSLEQYKKEHVLLLEEIQNVRLREQDLQRAVKEARDIARHFWICIQDASCEVEAGIVCNAVTKFLPSWLEEVAQDTL